MAKTKTSKVVKQQEVADSVKDDEVKQTTKKAVASKVNKTEEVVEDELEEEGDNVVDSTDDKKKRTLPTRDSVIASFDEIIDSIEKEIEVLRDSSNKTKGVKFLRTLGKKLKGLKGQSTRIISKRNPSQRKTGTNTSSGFLKPVTISKDIAKFAGWDVKEKRSRVQVTKSLCEYIREHKLQNEKDKRQILPDNKLCKLLNYDPKTATQPLTYFHLQSLLKHHFIKDGGDAITA
jgi:chromatin remodeling complex protein RSC6